MKKDNLEKKYPNVIPFMSVFFHLSPQDLEEIMEWLKDHHYLSDRGKIFKTCFWSLFIKE